MQIVVSQAWTIDADGHADAYIAKSEAMGAFLAAQPGFISRMLIRGVEDPTHFTNLRIYDAIASYEAMIQLPEYPGLIAGLTEHVDMSRYVDGYAREYMDVVLSAANAS